MNISEWQEHFGTMYGLRNHILMPHPTERIISLNIVIGDLHDAERKQKGTEKVAKQLARSTAAFFQLVTYFYPEDLHFWEALSAKYPATGCGYCGRIPCQCRQHVRLPHRSDKPISEQEGWTLRDWQTHLFAVYGENNAPLGREYAINRVFKEAAELLQLVERERLKYSVQQFVREYALESADILSWICGIASLYSLNLEEIVFARYGNGCSMCGKKVCECPLYNIVGGNPVVAVGSSSFCEK